MVNLEFIECVLESKFQKYSKKTNLKVIFKRVKSSFSKMMGCRKPFVEGARRNTHYLV